MKRLMPQTYQMFAFKAAQVSLVMFASLVTGALAQSTVDTKPPQVTVPATGNEYTRSYRLSTFQFRVDDARSRWFATPIFGVGALRSARLAAGAYMPVFDPFNSSGGFVSTSNPWNTSDSAFFPNGITTAGATNWIYGSTTLIGNAPSNGYGHQFNASSGASHVYLAIGGGNVGIGTVGPSARLHVAGPIYSSSAQTNSVFSGTIGASNANYVGTEGYWALRSATNNSYNLDVYNGGAPITAMTIMQNGNVGIGTTTPAGALDVAMSDATFAMFRGKSSSPSTGTGLLLYGRAADSAPAGQPLFWHFGVRYDGGGGSWPAGALGVYDIISNGAGGSAGVKNFMFFDPAGHTIFHPSAGNVGIGTVTPGYKLDVNGEINSTGLRINGTPISTGGSSQWSGSSSIYYNGGNVGIGTASPSYKLDVNGATQASTFRLANGFEMQQGAGNYGQFNSWVHLNGYHGFYSSINGAHIYPNNAAYGAWRIDGTRNGYGGINYNGKTALMMQDDLIGLYNEYYGKWILYGLGSTGNTLISPNGGNVGIGTTDPGAYKLNVNGEVNATGFRINGTPISSGGGSQWTDGSGSISYNGGNVGIGTTTPAGPLDVAMSDATFSMFKSKSSAPTTGTGLLLYGRRAASAPAGQPLFWHFGVRYDGGGGSWPAGALGVYDIVSNGAGGSAGVKNFMFFDPAGHTIFHPSAGNVGIGTVTPGYKLDVNGEINATGLRINGTPISTGGSSQWSGSSSIYYNGGNVGIGTADPGQTLDVRSAGSTRIQSVAGAANGYGLLTATTDAGYSSYSEFGSFGSSYSGTLFGQAVGNWSFLYSAGASSNGLAIGTNSSRPLLLGTSNTERMRIDSSGNVGIGTTTANDTLHVGGSGNFGIQIGRTWGVGVKSVFVGGIGSRMDFVEYAGSDTATTRMSILGGNVGIGTTSPGAPFTVVSNAAVTTPTSIIQNTHADGFASLQIDRSAAYRFAATRYSTAGADNWFTGTLYSGGNPNSTFSISPDYTLASSKLVVTSGGDVGIGTTTPGYKLDVNGNANVQGNITATGNISAKYQDVAEWVESSEQLAAGTVVVLDSSKSNQVIASSVSYDTRVAGVISAQPGITLGEKSESKVLVATTGRVKVKVDATKSPIHIGDLLVTSDIPGVAMKSEAVNLGGVQIHRPGTLIGKALEPLAKGKGEILVLLSLQ